MLSLLQHQDSLLSLLQALSFPPLFGQKMGALKVDKLVAEIGLKAPVNLVAGASCVQACRRLLIVTR